MAPRNGKHLADQILYCVHFLSTKHVQFMQKTALWLREPVAVNFATGSSAKPPGFLNMRPITKIMLVMRLTFILLFTSFMAVHATGVSQTITFSGKSVPLPKVFSVIKKQTGFVVFGNSSIIKEASRFPWTAVICHWRSSWTSC